ncbi:MAG: DUF4974 domain-containing protein [Bacteroidales bacterium]|jgi:ferric-dicitrate binding protein FerR (iron transport regulator)|nr:DUF4974 domain-containing protein [Bacteroidales bacterium]
MNKEKKEIILKYISGGSNEKEAEKALDILSSGEFSEEIREFLGELWQHDIVSGNGNKMKDPERMLDHIHHVLNISEERVISGKFAKYRRRLSRIAAILFIPLALFALWSGVYMLRERKTVAACARKIEITSQRGAITRFELADGTMVWLNHNSKLIYPVVFGSRSRTVELEGEGYFEVAENKKKPFIVRTQSGIAIKDLGTKFNISSFPGDPRTEVALLEGKVALMKEGAKPSGDKILSTLNPGEMAEFDKNANTIKISGTQVKRFIAWTRGKLLFYETPFNEVIPKIERWYNCKIVIKDKRILGLHLTATFEGEDLTQALSLMSIAIPIRYKIIPSRKLNDNSFSVREVLLYYTKGN